MDALELLEKDHRKVKKLLDQLDKTTERGVRTRQDLFAEIKNELEVHEAIEEEIFYPALEEHRKVKDLVLEAYEEHHVANVVVRELASLPPSEEAWGAKATVLKENIEHHIEEEEGPMFTAARKIFDQADLEELGGQMETRKAELLAEKQGV